MIFKKKGSSEDFTKYRAIDLLNHVYKILSVILLNRLTSECCNFFSDWQAGFRQQCGCRDNILLLRLLYDQIINGNSRCTITYIDYTAAFDTVSHKYIDTTLVNAGGSRKMIAIFRAIYRVAAGMVRANITDGKKIFSESFDVRRGVVQGDIISPVLCILALDQLVQQQDLLGTARIQMQWYTYIACAWLCRWRGSDRAPRRRHDNATISNCKRLPDGGRHEINIYKSKSDQNFYTTCCWQQRTNG